MCHDDEIHKYVHMNVTTVWHEPPIGFRGGVQYVLCTVHIVQSTNFEFY